MFAFLAGEILDCAEPAVRDLLLRLWPLEQIGGEAARRLPGNPAATDLLEEAGEWRAAIDLLFRAGNAAAAARKVLQAGPDLLAQGRCDTLKAWIDALPEAQREASAPPPEPPGGRHPGRRRGSWYSPATRQSPSAPPPTPTAMSSPSRHRKEAAGS